jgi:cobalamin synthase
MYKTAGNMSEPEPIAVLNYANLAGQRPKPTKHSPAVVIALLSYIGAVSLWSTVELYGIIKFRAYNRQSHLFNEVVVPYSIDRVMCWLISIGVLTSCIGLLQKDRKRWAALVALILSVVVFAQNSEALLIDLGLIIYRI